LTRSLVYLCFFLSGFSGLVYEIVWSRLFAYTMGSSHLSIAVVVSVFMGGLAAGSYAGGGIAERTRSPLRLYGYLVTGTGVAGAAVPFLLIPVEALLTWVYRYNDGEPAHWLFTLTKALACAATIFPPTFLMGATLPALAQHLTRNVREVGARLGALYAVNTFGAVAGAAAAGFFFLRWWGIGWTTGVAASVDLLVGILVLFRTQAASMRAAAPAPTAPLLSRKELPNLEKDDASRSRWTVLICTAAYGASGFANMVLQLGWTRALILSIGNSTYAFSVIVGIFIFGLAAGGWIVGLFADGVRNPAAAFGWLLVATAAAAGATIPWLGILPANFAWDLSILWKQSAQAKGGDFSFTSFLGAGAARTALAILPATVLMGMAFPLLGRIHSATGSGVGRSVGVVYAANTLGAIAGTALAGFVLVPLLGRIWALLYLAVVLSLAAGLVVLLVAPGRRFWRRQALAGAVVLVLSALGYWTRPAELLDSSEDAPRTFWHPVILANGSYMNINQASRFPSAKDYAVDQIRMWESLYYRDGEAGSVAVLKRREDGHTCLNISGKTDASAGEFSFDMQTQLLMGHLPLLVHPAPRRALNLGLGGGMSLGAMTTHPVVESIDLLELSPEVEEAARLYFARINQSALTNAKVRVVLGDGRNHLTHTAADYDVISSEPSNFWIAGLGNLFTEEFYRLVLQRLRPGGIACQWVYGYHLRLKDYKTALRTFLKVFPHVTVWTNNYADTILLGTREPQVFDPARLAAALAESAVQAELSQIGVTAPQDLFRYFQCEGTAIDAWLGGGPINRDLHPVLEFQSPLGYYDLDEKIMNALLAAAEGPLPPGPFARFSSDELKVVEERMRSGRITTRFHHHIYSEEYKGAIEAYRQLAQGGDSWFIDLAAKKWASRAAYIGEAILAEVRKIHDHPELCAADGYRPGPGGEGLQLEAFRNAARKSPAEDWGPYLTLAAVEMSSQLFADALKSLEFARERRAPPHKTAYIAGVLKGMQGDLAGAEKLLREAIASCPPGADAEKGEALYNLGFCLEQAKRHQEALSAYEEALKLKNKPERARGAIERCRKRLGKGAGG